MSSQPRASSEIRQGEPSPPPAPRGLYERWAAFGWPASYAGKLVLGAVVAALLPPLLVLWLLREALAERAQAALVGSLALGAVAAALVLWRMVAPVREAERAMRRYLDRGEVLPTPAHRQDEAGLLRSGVAYLVDHLAQRGAVLDEVAATDYLTGLPSRSAALERLRHNLSLALRDHLPLSLAILDVDDLQSVNTSFGHAVGDRVLVAFGQRLDQLVRGSDWVARWRGDSFLLALFADAEGARTALERFLLDLGGMRVVVADREIRCTAVAGACQVRQEESLQEALARLETQLARALAGGPGTIVFDA